MNLGIRRKSLNCTFLANSTAPPFIRYTLSCHASTRNFSGVRQATDFFRNVWCHITHILLFF